jgi:hypothetical protein
MPATGTAPEPVPTNGPPEVVPLAVWPCAQTSAQYQRAGRYLPASTSHPGKMLPELARRVVAEYCQGSGVSPYRAVDANWQLIGHVRLYAPFKINDQTTSTSNERTAPDGAP